MDSLKLRKTCKENNDEACHIFKSEKGFFSDGLIHKTKNGERVRSKSEVIIANALSDAGIEYVYEKPLKLFDKTIHPDFTITLSDGTECYWEHCGMMSIEKYKQNWEKKKNLYEQNGIEEGDRLFATYENGRFDSSEIENIIKKIKNK